VRLRAALACLAIAFAIVAAVSPGTVGGQPPACQAGVTGAGAGVEIHVNDSSEIWCSAQAIEAAAAQLGPVQDPVSGGPVSIGISVRNLLRLAQVTPVPVQLILLTRGDGTPSHLDRAELFDPAASFTNGLPAIVEIVGAETRYLRAARPRTRPRSQEDINQETDAQTPLVLSVFTTPALSVTIVAGGRSTTVLPHKPVGFSVSAVRGARYAWNFGQGPKAGGAKLSHTFDQSGPQDVYVTVRAPDGSVGVDSTQVNVARPHRAGPPVPPTKKKNTRSKVGSSGGGTGSGGTGSGGTGSGGTGLTGNSGNTNTNPSNSNRTNAGQGNSTNLPGNSFTTPTQDHSPTRSSIKSGAQGRHGGTIVAGRLISDVTPVSPAQLASGNLPPAAPVNQPLARRAAIDSGSVKPIAGLAGAGAIVLLLVSGAGRELRSLRRSIASARLG
jgi:PKD domain